MIGIIVNKYTEEKRLAKIRQTSSSNPKDVRRLRTNSAKNYSKDRTGHETKVLLLIQVDILTLSNT